MDESEPIMPKFDDVQSIAEMYFKREDYRKQLASIGLEGKESIEVDFQNLYSFDQNLATSLIEKPEETIKILENAARNQLLVEDHTANRGQTC
jgi:DNA replicative helicase MCM subunit Mcm2 (Cdc46/Mcm family)